MKATEHHENRCCLVKYILDWIEEMVQGLVVIALVFTFLFRLVTVTGTSMVPNYQNGDVILITDYLATPKQGDVVVLSGVLSEPIIKRVIAVENQTVDFDPETKSVVVNNCPVDDKNFGIEVGITDLPDTNYPLLDFPQTVPEGCVFVLGDNRPISEDSRYQAVGMVDCRHILGKALFRILPLKDIGPVK